MLSVSGARGIVGESMTPAVAADFARAFGSFVRETTGRSQPTLCVGRDTRPSGGMLSEAAAAGLGAVGCGVVDLGVAATPTVSVMIVQRRSAGGMVITASHNPPEWNGLKCINAEGMAPSRADTEEIGRRFEQRDFCPPDPRSAGPPPALARAGRANQTHAERVLAHVDADEIRRARLRVVLDSNNGAGGASGCALLERLGCTLVHVNGDPTGRFAHGAEPLRENLEDLVRRTAAEKAAVGFGQDPDADRLAIVDEKGRYIGEQYTLVLAAKRLLDLHGGGTIVVNLSTSRMIDDLAAQYPGAQVLRTPVGEAHVATQMKRSGALAGGEGNGGVIFPPVCWVRDSLSGMALVLSLQAAQRMPLSAIVDALPRYTMISRKFDLGPPGGRKTVRSVLGKAVDACPDAKITTADGVRMDFDDGWVHVRPSNTEPIMRLIAEARTAPRAKELVADVAAAMGMG
ncbi:MAG: phosphoglucosamine mutase [Planctomycetota bacterium]|jgi:phosphomannomutase